MRLFVKNGEEWVSMGEVREKSVLVTPIDGSSQHIVQAFFGKDFAVVRDDSVHRLG